MSFFEKLAGGAKNQEPQEQPPTFDQFQKSPARFYQKAHWNVPQGMTDPQQVAMHLMQSNQIPQPIARAAMQFAMRGGK